MSNLETTFIKEFKKACSVVVSKDIYKVPLPCVVKKNWKVAQGEMYAVKGITADYYKFLNRTYVSKLPRGTEAKKRVIDPVTRSFKRDENGSYVYEDVQVPNGSIVVTSNIKINLPYGYKEEGYGYIDFIKRKEETIYIYIIPKMFLYKVNQTALAVSVKNMKNFAGKGIQTWKMGIIFIHIIPYNPNAKYIGTKILKTGVGTNYVDDVKNLLNYWEKINFIPELKYCNTFDGNNIAEKETITGYSEYYVVEMLSLGERELFNKEDEVLF